MHYFIDGYNFIFRLPKQLRALEGEREQLVSLLLDIHLSMTLVFDGGMDSHSQRAHKGHLEIVYTGKNQSADEYIIDEIHRRKQPSQYTVVTSDKKLANVCHQMGAYSQSISVFLSRLKKDKKISQKEKPSRDTDRQFERLLKIFNELLDK